MNGQRSVPPAKLSHRQRIVAEARVRGWTVDRDGGKLTKGEHTIYVSFGNAEQVRQVTHYDNRGQRTQLMPNQSRKVEFVLSAIVGYG